MSRRPSSASRPLSASPVQAESPKAGAGHGVPDATVARLPVYLRALYALADH
jgi:redox-sensing transcriptional repressor